MKKWQIPTKAISEHGKEPFSHINQGGQLSFVTMWFNEHQLRFSSVPQGEWGAVPHHTMTAVFHVLSNLIFTGQPTTECYTV